MSQADTGKMSEINQTSAGMTATIAELDNNMKSAYGEGYNAKRTESLQSEIDHMSGENGKRAEAGNKAIGAYYASLENEKDKLRREAEDTAYQDIDKLGINRESAEAGKILMEARAKAAAQYNATTGAQQEAEMQRSLISSVGAILVADKTYWNAGYLEGKERSEGMMSAINDYVKKTYKPTTPGTNYDLNTDYNGNSGDSIENSSFSSDAYGLSYVPYDNFPALLHEGERVLTASEARALKTNAGMTVTVTGNSFSVREEADIYKIAQQIAKELGNAQMIS